MLHAVEGCKCVKYPNHQQVVAAVVNTVNKIPGCTANRNGSLAADTTKRADGIGGGGGQIKFDVTVAKTRPKEPRTKQG